MNRLFCKSALLAAMAILLASCAKETIYDVPLGNWTSYMTEYYIDGSSLVDYTSTKTAFYEKISFDGSGKCTVTIGGADHDYDYTFEKNIVTVPNLAKFKVTSLTSFTLVLAVDVEGDPKATSVYEYVRGEGLPVIYSNYSSFSGTDNRCFWYMDGKKKRVFCYPIIATIYGKAAYDEMSQKRTGLSFYDQIQYHFKKSK